MRNICLNVSFSSKFGLLDIRSRHLFLVSLLSVLLTTYLVSGVLALSTDGSVVVTELELITAIDEAPFGQSVIIVLGNNITLTESLSIPVGKIIDLSSDGGSVFKLVGAAGKSTIVVDGMLTLTNIAVTHENGDSGRGRLSENSISLFLIEK
ncbi:MAG: hypothetical protein LBH62_03180 [Nitrososphaerota archaeon]|nr:hypothetical protein [Nitrososphaerota archaeon]